MVVELAPARDGGVARPGVHVGRCRALKVTELLVGLGRGVEVSGHVVHLVGHIGVEDDGPLGLRGSSDVHSRHEAVVGQRVGLHCDQDTRAR